MIDNLPNDRNLEAQFIGQSLVDKRPAAEVSTTDFHDHNMRSMWAACLELHEEGREVEPFALLAVAKRIGLTRDVQVSELMHIMAGLVPGADCSKLADDLRSLALSRWLIRELYDKLKQLQNGESVRNTVHSIEESFDTIRTDLAPKKERFVSMAEIIDKDVIPALDRLEKGQTKKISTGFDKIDREIGGGIQAPEVWVVGADTGGGKSAFVLKLAMNIADQHVPVAYVSAEMSDEEQGLRAVSQASGSSNLNGRIRIHSDERETLLQWAEGMKRLPLYFDSQTTDLRTLRESLRSLVKKYGIKVLIIDYLQLFKNEPGDKRKRAERIADASQEIKRIAVEFDLAVIEVVQYNREGAKSGKASLHDFEGSGQIEKDASLIALIDREENSSKVVIRFVKGRNSGTCSIEGTFNGPNLKFEF